VGNRPEFEDIGIHLWGHQIEHYKSPIWKNAETFIAGALMGLITGIIFGIVIAVSVIEKGGV